MHVIARGFSSPEDGQATEDCEDALLFADDGRVAVVADGAGATSFAGLWAAILVRLFASDPASWLAPRAFLARLKEARQEWWDRVDPARLPPLMDEKAREGAAATLLCFRLCPEDGEGRIDRGVCWHAMAVGDSCLFMVRGGRLLVTFPLKTAREFNNYPALISSHPSHHCKPRYRSGTCEASDTVLLCTDAVAKYMLSEHENGGKPFAELQEIRDRHDWDGFVSSRRRTRRLRDDDATLVIIDICAE